MKLKTSKKIKTVSLNRKFTGSYKKTSVNQHLELTKDETHELLIPVVKKNPIRCLFD